MPLTVMLSMFGPVLQGYIFEPAYLDEKRRRYLYGHEVGQGNHGHVVDTRGAPSADAPLCLQC